MSEKTPQTFRYWLLTVKVTFELNGEIRHREDNTFLTTLEDTINVNVLNNARFMYLQDFSGHLKLKPEDIKNFVFLNIVNLGRMSDEEFTKMPEFSEESDQKHN